MALGNGSEPAGGDAPQVWFDVLTTIAGGPCRQLCRKSTEAGLVMPKKNKNGSLCDPATSQTPKRGNYQQHGKADQR